MAIDGCSLAPLQGVFKWLKRLLEFTEFIPIFRCETVVCIESIGIFAGVVVLVQLQSVFELQGALNYVKVSLPSNAAIRNDATDAAVTQFTLPRLEITTSPR